MKMKTIVIGTAVLFLSVFAPLNAKGEIKFGTRAFGGNYSMEGPVFGAGARASFKKGVLVKGSVDAALINKKPKLEGFGASLTVPLTDKFGVSGYAYRSRFMSTDFGFGGSLSYGGLTLGIERGKDGPVKFTPIYASYNFGIGPLTITPSASYKPDIKSGGPAISISCAIGKVVSFFAGVWTSFSENFNIINARGGVDFRF